MKSVKRSVRIQLITAFTACALLGLFVSKAQQRRFLRIANRKATIDYPGWYGGD